MQAVQGKNRKFMTQAVSVSRKGPSTTETICQVRGERVGMYSTGVYSHLLSDRKPDINYSNSFDTSVIDAVLELKAERGAELRARSGSEIKNATGPNRIREAD
ncbi:hypothetical protein EVAR_18361_1 [Eumeta japonica]|uniref:Uncharacterized protein n=1 Tax=Eumeta variegata TaxID=151549 RepID=A0A4C1UV69_EUMVA|nr:hypothetical protein EVAR_18361_1 [Eumeta japonica]